MLLRPPQRPDVSGAYALGTEVSTLTEDDRYLVMYDDGGYLLYQRYQVLDSGRYSVEDEKGARFRFTSDRGQGSYLAVFARPDTLYLPDRDTGIWIYSRFRNSSTLVFGPEYILQRSEAPKTTGGARKSSGPRLSVSKKRQSCFFEKDCMVEGARFLAKKSPLPP